MHYMTHVDEDILEDSVPLLISYSIWFSSDFVDTVILVTNPPSMGRTSWARSWDAFFPLLFPDMQEGFFHDGWRIRKSSVEFV
jgi:hypothetical protein